MIGLYYVCFFLRSFQLHIVFRFFRNTILAQERKKPCLLNGSLEKFFRVTIVQRLSMSFDIKFTIHHVSMLNRYVVAWRSTSRSVSALFVKNKTSRHSSDKIMCCGLSVTRSPKIDRERKRKQIDLTCVQLLTDGFRILPIEGRNFIKAVYVGVKSTKMQTERIIIFNNIFLVL